MALNFNVGSNRFEVSIKSALPVQGAIYPTIMFNIMFISKANVQLVITPVFRVRIKGKEVRLSEVGQLQFEYPTVILGKGEEVQKRIRLVLSPYGLKQLEDRRGHGDVQFNIVYSMTIRDEHGNYTPTTGNEDYTIAKSDWVEKHLSQFNYMEVSLLEVPKIDFPDFAEAAELLNNAWKKKHKGEFSEVMVACRKAIQYTTTAMKKAGFVTKDENDKKIPDWSQLAGTANIGEINGTITKKISGFIAPGAHHGKNFNVEDADYALMITHATVNYALKKLQQSGG